MSRVDSQNVPSHSVNNKNTAVKAVVVENFRVISQSETLFQKLFAQFKRQKLRIQKTEHFLCATNPGSGITFLVHNFYFQSLDNNIGYYLLKELAPLGLLPSEKAFGAALVGIIISTNLVDPVSAWSQFSLNTLQQIEKILHGPDTQSDRQDFIDSFAAIYQRLLALRVGSELLDVGCACAFWPILAAQVSDIQYQRIVGVDNRQDAINLSNQLAILTQTNTVNFVLMDVLDTKFLALGTFDTVTAIHVLEHIPEVLLPKVLLNLLQVTRHRLLIAVPYEEQPELAFGHEQVFNREKLETWGQWCVQQLEGNAKAYCEDVRGGLLIVERNNL